MTSRFGKFVVGGLAASLLGLLPGPSAAGQSSANLHVSLRVVGSCNVQTHPLTLADYAAGGPATGTATPGSIDVACAHGAPVAIYLDGHRTLSGANGARVAYEVLADGAPWRAGEPLHVKGLGRTPVHLALTGSVPGGQQVPLGQYEDDMVVRVVY